MKNRKVHNSFQLNGKSFSSSDEISVFSNTISASVSTFLSNWFSSDDFITVQTSGSTGKPKSIKLKKEFMINSALATGDFFDLKEKTTALLCLSTDFIAGKMMLVRALVLGWKLDVVAPVSNPIENLKKEYDFAAFVPMQLQNSLKNIHKIKTIIVGGGIVSSKLEKQIQNIKTQVFATYGMTETITHIAVKKLNNVSEDELISDSYYRVLPNIKIYRDTRNCLVIDAPKISQEIIITNDVVEIISENEFKWLGRFDNVINSGGIKLHPEIIEEKLSAIIKERYFVAGIRDEILGEKLVLVIESNIISNEKEKSLQQEIRKLKSLSKFEIPKEIYFVSKFIETETKKIQRSITLDLVNFIK